MKRIISILSNQLRQLYFIFLHKPEGTLIYLGMHKGNGFDKIFRKYAVCYGFEANPDLYQYLKEKYAGQKRVKIIHAAVAEKSGFIKFHVSNYDGSSSTSDFDENQKHASGIHLEKTIEVPAINLMDFFQENKIDFIEEYISDIQGYDLAVLKTIEPFIRNRKIASITCETTKDGRSNLYKDMPDNSESGFKAFLSPDYTLAATGWGYLEDGVFEKVPEDWYEMDCKWKRK